ncbi:MAG TPA: DUF4446 family protein [bacterium]|nr:DUF4446 family protein [bacterium]
MISIENLFTMVSIIVGVLFLLLAFLIFQIFKLKKRLDVFLNGENKDFEKIITNQIKKTEKHGKDIKKILEDISKLDEISNKSFQKIGIIRFNPFKEVGSDQSFAIAILDAENNGFVLTNHYGRELSRTYLKPVFNASSEYSLSKEEEKAIEKAIEKAKS